MKPTNPFYQIVKFGKTNKFMSNGIKLKKTVIYTVTGQLYEGVGPSFDEANGVHWRI
jgi:hypothetical protein